MRAWNKERKLQQSIKLYRYHTGIFITIHIVIDS